MSTFSLDQIREAAEAKYGSLDIPLDDKTTVRLLNPLRLSHEKRTELMAVQKELSADTEEGDESSTDDINQGEIFDKIFRLIAENEPAAEKLIAALDGDLAMKSIVFEQYGEGTQAGEASASQA